MNSGRDTICALASGAAPSAIAIIRVSGPDVQSVSAKLLKRKLRPSGELGLNTVMDADGKSIDTGLCVFMAGPKSYTGEDTLELNLHGGRYIIEKTLQALHALGVRLAEPGEYTRRAFEAGKLDLTQAEAIADLIEADTEAQHHLARSQLDGALSRLYTEWGETLTEILALLEANIDFPDEEDAPEEVFQPALKKLTALKVRLQVALEKGGITERIREGFRLVILGPPNAGKSTLLNRLARREAAIVTDIPGTTRDIVEVRLEMGGYLVWLADTAGLRETQDRLEQIGVERARRAAEMADMRLWLYPGDMEYNPDEMIRDDDIIAVNKCDLFTPTDVSREICQISAVTGAGVDELLAKIGKALQARTARLQAPTLTRLRHRQAIMDTLDHICQALDQLEDNYGIELVAETVRRAARAVAGLTGRIETEAVLGSVFENFCIGK